MKEIANTGTQRRQRNFLLAVVTIGWLLSIVALKADWLTLEEIKTVGVTFDRWWIAAGLFGGLYAAGEGWRKQVNAGMNK